MPVYCTCTPPPNHHTPLPCPSTPPPPPTDYGLIKPIAKRPAAGAGAGGPSPEEEEERRAYLEMQQAGFMGAAPDAGKAKGKKVRASPSCGQPPGRRNSHRTLFPTLPVSRAAAHPSCMLWYACRSRTAVRQRPAGATPHVINVRPIRTTETTTNSTDHNHLLLTHWRYISTFARPDTLPGPLPHAFLPSPPSPHQGGPPLEAKPRERRIRRTVLQVAPDGTPLPGAPPRELLYRDRADMALINRYELWRSSTGVSCAVQRTLLALEG